MLRVSRAAQEDIRAAALWYEQQQPDLGTEFVNEIDSTFSKIVSGPLRYPIKYRDFRRALVQRFSYAVYFDCDSSGNVLVIAVLHQRRDRAILDERV